MTTNERVNQAISVGMIQVDNNQMEAVIVASPSPETLSDDDWLDVLAAATEMRRALESVGYSVRG